MANTINLSFVKQFEREVHHVFQQMGSKWKNTVRTKTNIVGESTTFQKIGKGTTSTKAQGPNLITPMDVPHTPVLCSLTNHYAGEWVDDLDELKIQHDERRAVATSAAAALGRKVDNLIITAANTTTVTVAQGGAGMTLPKALEALELLGNADSLDKGRNYTWVGWRQWIELLAISEFKNADFVGSEDLPFKQAGFQGKFWLGSIWMPHTGLTLTSGSPDVRSCIWYNEFALGHAIGRDIRTIISYENPYASFFINSNMSMGACLIDETGCVKIECEET